MKFELFILIGMCIILFGFILEKDWDASKGWFIAIICQLRLLLYYQSHKIEMEKEKLRNEYLLTSKNLD